MSQINEACIPHHECKLPEFSTEWANEEFDETVTPSSPNAEVDSVSVESPGDSGSRRDWSDGDSDPSSHHPLHCSVKAVELGTQCKAKTLYEGPNKCQCCIDWVDETPKEVKEAKTKVLTRELHGGAALLVRKRKGHGGEDPFVLHSIIIQSPLIRKVLSTFLVGYPGINTESKTLSFEAPFQPLFHCWEDILTAAKEDTITETRNHLGVLIETLESSFEYLNELLTDCRTHGAISFNALWTILRPGILIYSTHNGQECIMRLQSVFRSDANYQLSCEYIDWDGLFFGYGTRFEHIQYYEGTAHVSGLGLGVMPLDLHPQSLEIKDRLMKRGKRFEALKGFHFKAYNGSAITKGAAHAGGLSEIMAGERIIIDAQAYDLYSKMAETGPGLLRPLSTRTKTEPVWAPQYPPHGGEVIVEVDRPRHCRQYRPRYSPPPPPPPPPLVYSKPYHPLPLPLPPQLIMPHGDYNSYRSPRQGGAPIPPCSKKSKTRYSKPSLPSPRHLPDVDQSLTEDECVLCTPHVRGFLLKDKGWAEFCVDRITDIAWNENAFDSLVLPNDEKELILAFAEGKANSNFDDFVQGKGKGIIMLLSGPPGVGKTLTAESVAETMRVPLYTMSAGELGTDVEDVEEILKEALEKCAKWKAILLLDEADIFLEKRDLHDLSRNALVSIFLRMLEYYEGFMFLTTNRVEAFDPAFESRIDIALNYPALTPSLRRKIWANFIKRLPKGERNISDADLDALAEHDLNGRQIKNAVKTAMILATKRRVPLCLGNFNAVLRLRAHLLDGAGSSHVRMLSAGDL